MKKLSVLLFSIFSLCLCVQAATQDEVKQAIIKQCNESGVEPAIMLSLAKVESGFRQEARGGGGAIGVFQLLPATGKFLGVNPYELEGNIKGGVLYYKSMYNMFGSMEKAVAAYNTGAQAVKRCNCIPAHAKPFVNKVMTNYNYYKTH